MKKKMRTISTTTTTKRKITTTWNPWWSTPKTANTHPPKNLIKPHYNPKIIKKNLSKSILDPLQLSPILIRDTILKIIIIMFIIVNNYNNKLWKNLTPISLSNLFIPLLWMTLKWKINSTISNPKRNSPQSLKKLTLFQGTN